MTKNKGNYKRSSPKNVTYSTRITEETKTKLEQLASLFDKSQSEVFEDLIESAYSHFLGKTQNVQLSLLQ